MQRRYAEAIRNDLPAFPIVDRQSLPRNDRGDREACLRISDHNRVANRMNSAKRLLDTGRRYQSAIEVLDIDCASQNVQEAFVVQTTKIAGHIPSRPVGPCSKIGIAAIPA